LSGLIANARPFFVKYTTRRLSARRAPSTDHVVALKCLPPVAVPGGWVGDQRLTISATRNPLHSANRGGRLPRFSTHGNRVIEKE
jgi:hypothetical protein